MSHGVRPALTVAPECITSATHTSVSNLRHCHLHQSPQHQPNDKARHNFMRATLLPTRAVHRRHMTALRPYSYGSHPVTIPLSFVSILPGAASVQVNVPLQCSH